jgi:hypothetical protein
MLTALLSSVLIGQQVRPVSFELNNNRIYVRTEIAGKGTWSVLETGSSTSLLDYSFAREAGIKGSRVLDVVDFSGEPGQAMQLATREIKVRGTTLKALASMAVPLSPAAPLEGRSISGVLGHNFLSQHSVRIDYQRKTLRLLDLGTRQPASSITVPIEVESRAIYTFVRVKPRGGPPIAVRAMIDTGVPGLGVMRHHFAKREGLWDSVSAPVEFTGSLVGGASYGKAVRLESLQMGPIMLQEPVMVLASKDVGPLSRQERFEMLLGAEALKRYVVTIDYWNRRMYLEPTKEVGQPFIGHRSGIVLAKRAEGVMVHSVWQNSPGLEAGLQAGDKILAIGPWTDELPNLEMLRQFMSLQETAYEIKVSRGSEVFTAKLQPREIVL